MLVLLATFQTAKCLGYGIYCEVASNLNVKIIFFFVKSVRITNHIFQPFLVYGHTETDMCKTLYHLVINQRQ
jgi:hypothetical protein